MANNRKKRDWDAPQLHGDHPRPVTRRQFVAQGFMSGAAYTIGGGAVMGMTVVGLATLGLGVLYLVFTNVLGWDLARTVNVITGFSMGVTPGKMGEVLKSMGYNVEYVTAGYYPQLTAIRDNTISSPGLIMRPSERDTCSVSVVMFWPKTISSVEGALSRSAIAARASATTWSASFDDAK